MTGPHFVILNTKGVGLPKDNVNGSRHLPPTPKEIICECMTASVACLLVVDHYCVSDVSAGFKDSQFDKTALKSNLSSLNGVVALFFRSSSSSTLVNKARNLVVVSYDQHADDSAII
jgi:hypothetical protein